MVLMERMASLQQSPNFARALTAYGAPVASSHPVILHRKFGPLGRVAFASRAAPDAVADTPVRILNGETPCPRAYRRAGFRQIITASHIAEWDLTQPDLRRTLHGKWRNQLRKGERNGLRIREAPWEGRAHPMFQSAEALAHKRRYRNYPPLLLSAYAQMNPSDTVIFEAYDRGTLVAACLTLRHGKTATYQTAWANATGRALQAPRVVLFAAAQQMSTLGHDTLDLGVVETDHAPGLARFKLGTGADVRPLGGTWCRLRAG